MEIIKTLVVLAGLGLVWHGYNKPDDVVPVVPPVVPSPVDPSPVVPVGPIVPTPLPGPGGTLTIITSPEDQPAPAPTNPAVLTASQGIYTALAGGIDPNDALKLARAYKAWGELIATDTTLKSISEFQQAYIKATQVLLSKHKLAGKYALNAPTDATMIAAFTTAGLTENNALKQEAWSPAAAQSAKDFFNAVSYQCFKAYVDSVPKPKPT